MPSPICLFTYTRLEETKQTVSALKQNHLAPDSDLYIFSDGPRDEKKRVQVRKVREYLKTIEGFRTVEIIESAENKGLARSIVSGVSQVLETHDSVIVLEDDLVTTPNFLDFMNQALTCYSEEKCIQSVSAYSLLIKKQSSPVYFQTRPGSWGWGTWSYRWKKEIFDKTAISEIIKTDPNKLRLFGRSCGADIPRMLTGSLENQNDSWYVLWAFDHYLNGHYSVYPQGSLVKNIGFGLEGTHCKGINTFHARPADPSLRTFRFVPFQPPPDDVTKEYLYYFTRQHKLVERLKLLTTSAGRKMIKAEIRTRWLSGS